MEAIVKGIVMGCQEASTFSTCEIMSQGGVTKMSLFNLKTLVVDTAQPCISQ